VWCFFLSLIFIFSIFWIYIFLLWFFFSSIKNPNNSLWGTEGVRRSDTRRLTQLVAPKTGHAKFYAATKARLRPSGVEPLLEYQQHRLL
jgi:hypothetical protein